MARTAIPYALLVANGSTSSVAGSTGVAVDPTNDHVIAGAAPGKTLLRVTNTDGSAHNVTVKASKNLPSYGSGADLVVSVPATTGDVLIGPLESGRFTQPDGSMLIDLDTGHAGRIVAYKIPKGI